jgi:cysteine synthase
VVRRFRFPPQEHKFSAGGTARDHATDKRWSVCDEDDARGTIDLKTATAATARLRQRHGRLATGEGGTASAAAVRLAVSLRRS